ncbi:peroxiredoxin [Sphingomonas hengshuiensis]|uniref:thioredoxin-dependent peroxiredoxin n=1 Tax=Sphingomonas hengshuiensis TaxID=1609977 RepID=A0A7U4J857_9SPHN|nr:peroxiredoxin [Sphingomonas hengshuiensis]AJP72030.1 alkyl hydroperoxide reductase [Sphingomonas hengshuiensis]
MAIEEGDKLPAVELDTPNGGKLNLADCAGRPFVLYFYPKDDTSGCTREAQDFSALLPEFEALGAQVVGVSKDPAIKHQKFIAKYDLTVSLATDTNGDAMEAFGVWVEKQLYGKRYMGIDRSTFLFAPDGRLFRAWRRVKVPGHAVDVLESVKAIPA